MAKEIEVQNNDQEMKALLQLLLEEKGKELKEQKQKEDEIALQRKSQIEGEVAAAREQNERNKHRRDQCDGSGGPPHQTLNPANGNKRSAWRGQVNSDGTFSPVCCKCLMVMPKIKATDEQKKEGVNLGGYVELSVVALERWHKASFADGCDNKNCYLCHPVQELVTA